MKKHLLFICRDGVGRCSCAEELFEDSALPSVPQKSWGKDVEARSAGFFVMDSSKEITREKIRWASVIFVMDEKKEFHKTQLLQKFPEAEEKEIVVLGISNDFGRNDKELEKLLREKLGEFL